MKPMKKPKNKKRISIRSRIPFPPTKVFADIKKQLNKEVCRKKIGNACEV